MFGPSEAEAQVPASHLMHSETDAMGSWGTVKDSGGPFTCTHY